MAEGLSLYHILGCEQGALFAELRACFKRRALSVHPDKGGSKEAFQQVLAAFETLADPVARAGYDRRHAAAVRHATTTRAEQDAEAEGGRGSKRKRRRTGEGEERQQKNSSFAPGGVANPHEEQRPKQQQRQQQQPQAKQSTSRADQDAEAEGGRGSKPKRRRTGEERQQNSSSSAPGGAATPHEEQQPKQQQQRRQRQRQQQQQQAKQSTSASSQDRPCQAQDDSTPASQIQEPEVEKTISLAEQVPADRQEQAPRLAEQAPAGQKSQRTAHISEEFLFEKLRQLLQRLPSAFRKAVIGEIPQNMRRALELWMVDRRTQAARADPEVSQKLCQRSGDCSEDTSEDSSHDSSECNEAEADCALALCDTTTASRDASCEEVISMSDDSSDMSEQEPDTHLAVCSGASVPDKTSNIMQSLEEEFLPEVGPGSGSHRSRRSSHGRTGVRGIVNVHDTSYGACRHIGIFSLISKSEPDLATALDHLAIITVLKQRAQHGILNGDNFEDCMRRALVETESEVGVEAMEDLGLKFFLTLSKSYWIGGHTQVVTPRIASLETALAYRRQFAELQEALSHRGVVSSGLLNRHSITDLEDNWHRFCVLYIEACCGLGETANFDASSRKSREAVAKRLAALVEANSANREKQLRAWNCRRMLEEERLQRQAARTERHTLLRDRRAMSREERLQRQAAQVERRALLRERRAMGGEDREEVRCRKLPVELVQNLVRRWERLQTQRRRQEAAVLQQELAKQRAAARVELSKQRAATKVELRRCRTEREERWRWLNRRDLTMADMLGAASPLKKSKRM
ncbi:unnamed protein product [Polarella glacialis]|uniref:J domain-containing protein n=1 Tax=Polarella glacialis TaxID=89957 RepID=A0A813DPX6_POLGL|nr:unnamed protein product [Polarella glacialis]